MTLQQYLEHINTRYSTGISREHSYRGDLQNLLESLAPDVLVTNEPARIACGAPDYIITKKEIPVGYIEAKDIGVNLSSKTLNEQFERYRASLDNLIITDYLDFHLYIDGEFKTSVKIAEIQNGKIHPLAENFSQFENLIKDFCTYIGQTIKSAKKLAEMMAGKARMLSEVIEKALESDEENQENSSLKEQMSAFKEILIHDIKPKEFADIYAQTIAYGMFAARLHDPDLHTFSRKEAAELIPKTNPFLRKLFQYIAGYDLDSRIVWIVDGLADLFRATDVAALLKNFGKATQQHDPIIHFYETFLAEYDPKLRKSRGVWYTPEPVVNFIVRAVDDILKTEFGLKNGLADTAKTKVKIKIPTHDKRYAAGQRELEHEVHKVQILDPAAGTGTFLAEVVKHIHKKFEGQQGIWSGYVEDHLIPRLNGFEILMASYAMAHLKLDLLLTESGFKPKKDQRFRIYLTNSLEEHHPDTGTLFANWLSAEANEANHIKRDTPVMVVLGNPPYSVSSSNKSAWIEELMKDFKRDLNEKNIQPLSDDYIKFIRFGEHFIEKNGEGVLAYISNNSFIDGLIHRQMRKHLLETFDKIYILDLHGNAKKKETAPDGGKDENVFDIMQGVSINIFIKKDKKNGNAEILHFDLFGSREYKYRLLSNSSIKTLSFNKLELNAPNYYFVKKDFYWKDEYETGFQTSKLFNRFNCGLVTARDHLIIHYTKNELDSLRENFQNLDEQSFRKKYNEKSDSRDWTYENAKTDSIKGKGEYTEIQFRPFDIRHTFYTGKTKGFMSYPRSEIMSNLLNKENVGLILPRQLQDNFHHIFITDKICDGNITSSARLFGAGYIFPLYLYPENKNLEIGFGETERTPNLNKEIVNKIAEKLGLAFVPEKEDKEGTFAPIDLLDYIYAVLHSPTYREKYKEFLKIDFPRVPYPKDVATFQQLVKLGSELRQVHLLESPLTEQFITTYPQDGNNIISRKISKKDFEITDEEKALGRVWINDEQYFDKVPAAAWEFYVGGYQPAQKWLKDRTGRQLSFDDILHYQKIIVALDETDRIMKEIDKVEIEEIGEVLS